MNVPHELLTFLESREVFLLLGHEHPDGDCLGSQIALGSFLRRRGKAVHLYSPGPFQRPETLDLEHLFLPDIAPDVLERNPGVIILDSSTIDRVGNLASRISGLDCAVIDHHTAGKPFGAVHFIDPEAPSVTYMIQQVIEAMGDQPTPEEAQVLFFGLCTDTGFFRHLAEGSDHVFAAASKLIESGANPKTAHRRMYAGKSLESRRMLGRVLSSTKQCFDGRVLIAYERMADIAEFGIDSRDSDQLYSLLQGVRNVDIVVYLREEGPKSTNVGLRSVGTSDMGALAKSFGGGGHVNAAGFTVELPLSDVEAAVVERLPTYLS
jgi:phosphoesterase RecJ-like protein